MGQVKDYLERTYKVGERLLVRDGIKCNDGFFISVQGGTEGHYCEPRCDCNVYSLVECGFPSEEVPELFKYAEDKDNLTATVYGYVPIDIVEKVVEKHGGIKEGE